MLEFTTNLDYTDVLNPGGLRFQSADGIPTLTAVAESVCKWISPDTVLVPIGVRALRSDKNCRAQHHHADFNIEKSPAAERCSSVIIALQKNTSLEICWNGKIEHVQVPYLGAVVWGSSVYHGGAAYSKDNYRIFFKAVPEGDKEAMVPETEIESEEVVPSECQHNK